jgi:hypothetical protein
MRIHGSIFQEMPRAAIGAIADIGAISGVASMGL